MMGPRLKGVPSCLLSVTRVHVREAVVGSSETSEAVHSEGSGDEGTSGVCVSEWWLSFEVWNVFDI